MDPRAPVSTFAQAKGRRQAPVATDQQPDPAHAAAHSARGPAGPACFELFGFDVILDRQLRPWLLEVNASPSISCSCEVDRAVKLPMLEDVLDIMGWDTDTYPPETMRRLHRDAANTLSLEEQRRRVLSGKAHADDFLLPKHLGSLASPGSPSSPPPEAVDYKNVRSKVSTRWGRGGAAAHSSAR